MPPKEEKTSRFAYFTEDQRVFASEFRDGEVVVSGSSMGVGVSIVLNAGQAKALGEWLLASSLVPA